MQNKKVKPISGRIAVDYPFELKKVYRCLQDIGGLVPGELVRILAQNFHGRESNEEFFSSGFDILAQRINERRKTVKFGVDTKRTAQVFFEPVSPPEASI